MSDYLKGPKKSESDKNHIKQNRDRSKKGFIRADEQINILSEVIIDLLLKDNYEKENSIREESNGVTP